MRVALIAGSTGLIGKSLLQKLLNDSSYHKVISIARRRLEFTHPKLHNIVSDFDSIAQSANELIADDVFCCLGTTMKKAGSKEKFWKVDHDYPLELARICKVNGSKRFMLVSALGADKNSSFYYNEVKGKVEEAIDALSYESYHIFRPSLLLGQRQENRPGEEAAKSFYKIFNFLIPEKYKGIEGSKVAAAMLHFAKDGKAGKFIHMSAEMQRFES
jgi:uncharacterized protein YbjT (DUF2867 family)